MPTRFRAGSPQRPACLLSIGSSFSSNSSYSILFKGCPWGSDAHQLKAVTAITAEYQVKSDWSRLSFLQAPMMCTRWIGTIIDDISLYNLSNYPTTNIDSVTSLSLISLTE